MATTPGVHDDNAGLLLTLARHAAVHFGHSQARLAPLDESDNTVFRVDTGCEAAANAFVLRLHTSGRQNAAALGSELVWLNHLAEQTDLPVPRPVLSDHGTWLVGVSSGSAPPVYTSMLNWIEGEVLNRPLSVPEAHEVGQLLARLHFEAERFVPSTEFTRPEYAPPYFLSCWSELRATLGPDRLSADDQAIIDTGLSGMTAQVSEWQNLPGGFGLIHGDIHTGNLVGTGGQLSLIDFDRCGWGPYLLDIAGAVMDMEAAERAAFLTGYTQIRPLAEEYRHPMRALMCLAALENLAFLARRPHELPFVVEALPFLIKVITEVSEQPESQSSLSMP